MEKNLYIDASHPDETRIVLKSENHIEEYEYENKNKPYLKNNIYLGKVSRIEPSLQAAFVDYGKQRHGFLAFNDIQTDYYQIPHDDKEKLKREEENLRLELKEKSNNLEVKEKNNSNNNEEGLEKTPTELNDAESLSENKNLTESTNEKQKDENVVSERSNQFNDLKKNMVLEDIKYKKLLNQSK